MFTTKTTLILGAGASRHLHYPTGSELIDQVRDSKHKDYNDNTQALSRLLRDMQPLSIDMFLSYHPELEQVGKELIAHEILKHEDKTLIVENNWYRFLIDSLISQCRKPEDILINNENLTIVTFNYDLSLEYYIFTRLKQIPFFQRYVNDFLKNLNITHVYGQLGCFDWHEDFFRNTYDKEPVLRKNDSYGSMGSYFIELAKGIEIIGIRKWENSQVPRHIQIIRKQISNSIKIYILGFGFYEENMELLHLNKQLFQANNKLFYYTNFEDHQKNERQFLKRRNNYSHTGFFVKSTGSVYDALNKDFDLIE